VLSVRLADRYDIAAVAVVIAVSVGIGLVTNSWFVAFAFGAALGNLAAYRMRRRAGVTDRSPIGQIRGRNNRLD
jgi:hypothetical protein